MGKIKTNRIYKNKDLETNKKYIQRRNDIITYRLFILFGLTVGAVSFFIFAMNMTTYEDLKRISTISFAGLILTGISVILSVLFFVRRSITGIDESDKPVNSKNILAAALFAFFADSLIFFTGQRWIAFLTALVISVTVLVYLYYLYQREFFLFALFTAAGCFFLYLAETPLLSDFLNAGCKVLLAATAVFIFAFSLLLMKNKGRVQGKVFNIQINKQILEHDAKYFQFFILAALIAVCCVLGFISVSFLSFINFFYLICAVLACFIIFGIYFTVKII